MSVRKDACILQDAVRDAVNAVLRNVNFKIVLIIMNPLIAVLLGLSGKTR